MRKALTEAGFHSIEIKEISMTWVLQREVDLFYAFFTGTPRTGGLLRAQEAEKLEAIKNAVAACASDYKLDGAIRIPMSSVLASAIA